MNPNFGLFISLVDNKAGQRVGQGGCTACSRICVDIRVLFDFYPSAGPGRARQPITKLIIPRGEHGVASVLRKL